MALSDALTDRIADPMAPPWTAAQAASDEVSKKMLITYLQENADDAFLGTHKVKGAATAVAKRVTKDQLVEAYKKYAGLEGGAAAAPPTAPPPGPSAGFSFSPSGGDSKFTFGGGAPAPPAAPAAGASNFTFNFSAPEGGGGKGGRGKGGKGGGGGGGKGKGGGRGGGKGAPPDDDGDDDEEDDDLEEIDTSKMKKSGGGGIPVDLQARMARLNMSAAERREASIAELPKAVAACVESLEGLQEKTDALQKEFDEKLQKLKEEYGAKKAPFYKQRSDIVGGKDGKEGIPGFWLQAMQNNMLTAEEIQQHDEEPLKALLDIKVSAKLGDGQKGFQLCFVFAPNDYFDDEILTKTYLMDPDDEDECLTKAIGSDIAWKPNKNITVKKVQKKQKKGARPRVHASAPECMRSADAAEMRCCGARAAVSGPFEPKPGRAPLARVRPSLPAPSALHARAHGTELTRAALAPGVGRQAARPASRTSRSRSIRSSTSSIRPPCPRRRTRWRRRR